MTHHIPKNGTLLPSDIIRSVNKFFEGDCTCGDQANENNIARHCAMYLMFNYSNFTQAQIAELMKRKHPSTVYHAVRSFKPDIHTEYNQIVTDLGGIENRQITKRVHG